MSTDSNSLGSEEETPSRCCSVSEDSASDGRPATSASDESTQSSEGRVVDEKSKAREKSHHFYCSKKTWKKILKGATVKDKSQKNSWLQAGAGWRDIVSEGLGGINRKCNVSLRRRNLAIRPPTVKWTAGNNYAVVSNLKCVRKTDAGETCNVTYTIRILKPPQKDDRHVRFDVTETGDSECSHASGQPGGKAGDSGLSKTAFRKNLTGAKKEELLAKGRAFRGSLSQFVQELSAEAVKSGAIETGNLTDAPSYDAVRKTFRRAAKAQMPENVALEVETWNQ